MEKKFVFNSNKLTNFNNFGNSIKNKLIKNQLSNELFNQHLTEMIFYIKNATVYYYNGQEIQFLNELLNVEHLPYNENNSVELSHPGYIESSEFKKLNKIYQLIKIDYNNHKDEPGAEEKLTKRCKLILLSIKDAQNNA